MKEKEPKKRRRKQIAVGFIGAAAFAGALSQIGKEPKDKTAHKPDSEVTSSRPRDAGVAHARKAFGKALTEAAFAKAGTKRMESSPDSGPTDNEVRHSLLEDAKRAIIDRMNNYDQELLDDYTALGQRGGFRSMLTEREFEQFVELQHILRDRQTYSVSDWYDIIQNSDGHSEIQDSFSVNRGLDARFVKVCADPENGTLTVGLVQSYSYSNTERPAVIGVEPGLLPDLLNELSELDQLAERDINEPYLDSSSTSEEKENFPELQRAHQRYLEDRDSILRKYGTIRY